MLGAALVAVAATSGGAAQREATPIPKPTPAHVTIPYLANASSLTELDYAAAECDLAIDALTMTCRFRQVFLTPVSFEPTTCAITSNGYERTFTRAHTHAARWISEDPPQGSCGIVETHALDDGGGTRWTLTVTTTSARATDRDACSSAAATVVYDWRVMKRALPCLKVQPGAIER